MYQLTLFSCTIYSNRDSAGKNNRQEDDESNGKCGLNKKSNISKDSKKEDKGCGDSEGITIKHWIGYLNLARIID